MTKSDLRTGHIVTLRDGDRYTVYKDCVLSEHGDVIVSSEPGCSDWDSLSYYNENLKHEEFENYDIVKVEVPEYPYNYNQDTETVEIDEVIWERPEEKKKMTVAEIEQALGYGVEIVSDK